MDKKQDMDIYCIQETNFRSVDTYRLKVRGWKKSIPTNRSQKKAGVAILISNKTSFQIKAIRGFPD